MNIFTRIKNWFVKSYWQLWNTVLFSGQPNPSTNKDFLDTYEMCSLVNSCVRKIAEKVAGIELKLYKVIERGNNTEVKEIKDHPLLDLLAQMNPFETKFEMIEGLQTYIELLGNAYWLKVRGENTKKILELWQLRPDWVKIIEDPEKIVKGYKYTMPGGVETTFQPDDVLHFKQINPKSSFYGLSTIAPAMDIVRSFIFANKWNMKFFYNSARPDFLLISKTRMGEEARKELKRAWSEEFGGMEGAHKFGIAEGEIDIKNLGFNMREMEFPKLIDVSREQIMSSLGVPKSLLGLQGMNRAEAEAQIYVFLSETIEPKIRRIVEKLNEFLVPEFGDNLHLSYVNPTPENRDAIIKEYEMALRNNWMVINEVRDKEGLPPLEGGWDFYLSAALIPAGGLEEQKSIKLGSIKPRDYYKHKKEKEQERLKKQVLTGKRKLKLEMQLKKELVKYFINSKPKAMNEEQKQAHWRQHDKQLIGDERIFAAMTRRLLRSQEERVKDALQSQFYDLGKSITKKIELEIDWVIEDRVFAEVSTSIFTDIVNKRGTEAAKLVGMETFNHTDRIIKFIDRKAMKFAEEVNSTTKDKLKKALAEGIEKEEGIKELSARVSDVFKTRRKAETERIARTEVLCASNKASIEAYRQSGVVEKKEWLATKDERTRDQHLMMNGEVALIGQRFSNGLSYPGDPRGDPSEIINCRCSLLPVIE